MSENNISVFELAHKLHNLLRNQEGIIGEKALYEINMAFTIRLIEPLIEKNKLLKMPDFCKFTNLVKLEPNKMISDYRKIGLELQKNDIMKQFNYKNTLIQHADTCFKFINYINQINIENEDVKGKIWEYFIGRDKDTISDLGQYFTSNRIVQYCINLVKPTLDDTILDPTCGSGGFLSNCALYLDKEFKVDWSKQKEKFKGYDIAQDVVKLGLVNMLICTGELFTDQIQQKDTFRKSIEQKYDIILANPPYGGDKKTKKNKSTNKIDYNSACQEIKDFGVQSNVKELLFLQMIMSNLKDGGRACVVLPEGLFSNISDKSFYNTRKKLVEEFNIIEIGCASNEFDNTSVNTCVIYFEKTGKTKKIKFTNILNGKHLITVKYEDIYNCKYILNYNIYLARKLHKIDNYNIVELNNNIIMSKRGKYNSKDGLECGLYRLYTCSNGSFLFVNNATHCEKSIICARGCTEKINIDKKFSCTEDNLIFTAKEIPIEWIYYYLKENLYLFKMLMMGTVIKHINASLLKLLNIHVPKDTQQMEIIKQLHDKIQLSKEKLHSKTRNLEYKINELPVIQKIKLEPLYKPDTSPFEDEKDGICDKAYELHNLLRNEEGIIGERALQEISLIFTIRSLEKLINNKQVKLPDFCKWSNFSKINEPNQLISDYRKIHQELWKNNIYDKEKLDFREIHIKYCKTLEKMINLVKEINFDENEDLKGKIYEAFIGRDKKNIKDLGQYFTNHKLVSYCINLLKPKLEDTILDPTCGSGGFLVNSALYLNKNNDNIDWKTQKDKFRGYDIAKDVSGIAVTNLLLSTGELFKEQIQRMDTLHENINEQYDIILANPPYGGDKGNKKTGGTATNYNKVCSKNKNIKEFGVESKIKELLFTQMIMTRLKPNGRCCIVLPEGLFFKGNKDFVETRKKLVEEFNVVEIGYASNEFENTSVNTCIVYFENNGQKTKKILFRDIKTGKEIITVKYKDIVANNYVLVYNAYIIQICKPIDDYKMVKLENCINFIKLKKRNADYGLEEGLYRFYTCSVGTRLYCNEIDCKERSVIVATGGSPKVNIDENFGTSADNFAFNSKDNTVLVEWIYYYLNSNMYLLEYLFLGTVLKHLNKTFFSNITIHVPPMEEQLKVKKLYDKMFNTRIKYETKIRKLEDKIMNMDVLKKVKLQNPLEEIKQDIDLKTEDNLINIENDQLIDIESGDDLNEDIKLSNKKKPLNDTKISNKKKNKIVSKN